MNELVRSFLTILWTCLFLCVAPQAAAGDRLLRVSDVRFGDTETGTRVVVDVSGPVEFRHFGLPAGDPRIVLEMPRVRWSIDGLTTEAGKGKGAGLIGLYRYQHNSATTSRLVLDLDGPAIVTSAYMIKPDKTTRKHRVVLELKRASKRDYLHMAGVVDTPEPATTPRYVKSSSKRDTVSDKRRKPVIVIDAGHGGKDPGAIGANGHYEKDVTLSAALELADRLRRSGRYDVKMTRDDDTFIELEDRVTLARGFKADLFISLHADAIGKAHTRGASVYTLSESGERRQNTLRQSENWLMDVEKDTHRPEEVNVILASLIETETKNQSSRFAQMLIPNIEAAGWPTLRNTHRNAGFYVLLAPDVPAVLVEMGYMTNVKDEKLLTNKRHRRRLIGAMQKSIDAFFTQKELYASR